MSTSLEDFDVLNATWYKTLKKSIQTAARDLAENGQGLVDQFVSGRIAK
jgi:hypothetical protein